MFIFLILTENPPRMKLAKKVFSTKITKIVNGIVHFIMNYSLYEL